MSIFLGTLRYVYNTETIENNILRFHDICKSRYSGMALRVNNESFRTRYLCVFSQACMTDHGNAMYYSLSQHEQQLGAVYSYM